MTLLVELGNKAASEWTEITTVKLYEGMRVGGNAHLGEIGTGSGFDLDDDAGVLSLPVKRVLRVRETATSPDTILVRGRVAEKGVARGDMPLGDARAYDVQLDDQNADLRGIPIKAWSRPEETDYQRVIALWKKFLKGKRRASTRLRIDYVRNANRRTLPKQTYRNTDPYGIWADIAEAAGKEFFVTVDGEMFHDLPTSTRYAASLSITDDDPNLTDEFPPVFGASGDYDGSEFLSGATIEYGNRKRVSAVRSAVEDAHDYWRTILTEDATGQNDARRRLKALLSRQAREDATYSIDLELTADQVDMIKYGQTVSFRSAAAGITTPVVLRVGRLMWEPTAPGRYVAHLELGFPKKLVPRIKRGGSGGSAGGGGSNPGVYTTPGGPVLSPPAATTTAYLDHFERTPGVAPTIVDAAKDASPAGTSHSFTLPEGIDVPGRRLLIAFFYELDAETISDEVTAAGFTYKSGYGWDPGPGLGHTYGVYERLITGDEGWVGDGTDELSFELDTGTGVIHAEMLCLEGAASAEVSLNIDGLGNDPPSLDPSVDPDTGCIWLTLCLSSGAITGDPSGYINLDSDTGGTLPLYWRMSQKTGTAATEDPSAYTASGSFDLTATICVPGDSDPDGLGRIPLGSEVGGWWPGDNEYISFFASFVGDHGIESDRFFAESSAGHETSGNNWIVSLLGRDHADGPFPVLPMEVDSWEMEGRYRLLGAAGSLTDPGERYVYLDWMFSGQLRLDFGDATNAPGIAAVGETTSKVEKSLTTLGEWGRIKWRWHAGRVYVKEWEESTTEPDWDTSVEIYSGLDPSDVEFDIAGRLGNASGPVQRFELDWLRMLIPDPGQAGYAGEVYGLTPTVAVP